MFEQWPSRACVLFEQTLFFHALPSFYAMDILKKGKIVIQETLLKQMQCRLFSLLLLVYICVVNVL